MKIYLSTKESHEYSSPLPSCKSVYAYEDGAMLICPVCAHERSSAAVDAPAGVVVEGVLSAAGERRDLRANHQMQSLTH